MLANIFDDLERDRDCSI